MHPYFRGLGPTLKRVLIFAIGVLSASFTRDLQDSEQLEPAQWQQRSVIERIEEAIAGSLEPML
jgi:hypothetical protein